MRAKFKQISDLLPDVIARLGQGKERRDEFVCHCPFHQERFASFSLNMAKGVYICFSCGASGSISLLAIKLGLREDGQYNPSFKRKSAKLRAIQPWQSAKRIGEAFKTVENSYLEEYRSKRNRLESDWNEGRISEEKYYAKRQLLNYDLDCKMEVNTENLLSLSYNAKNGGRGDEKFECSSVNGN